MNDEQKEREITKLAEILKETFTEQELHEMKIFLVRIMDALSFLLFCILGV